MSIQFNFILTILLSYILGCISTGYYLVRIFAQQDIRHVGSGSTGATNVGRVLGRKGFIATVLLDIFKGLIVGISCRILEFTDFQLVISIIALTLGHIWPAQLKFSGGKGMAVMLSSLFILDMYSFIIYVFVILIVYLIIRKFSISGLIALLVFPLENLFNKSDYWIVLLLFFLIFIVYFAHRDNIREYLKLLKSKT